MNKEKSAEEKDKFAIELIKRIKDGNLSALENFFQLYSDDIYNFPIRNFQFNEDEAGDFYLFVFERLKDGRKLSKFSGKSKFRTWFFSVLKNFSIDYLRWKNNHSINESPQGDVNRIENLIYENQTEDDPVTHEIMDSLNSVIADLSDYDRIVFKLVFIFYTFLTENEMKTLQSISGLTQNEIMKTINNLKEIALEKAENISAYEESANRTFIEIVKIERKLNSFFEEHPTLSINSGEWNEAYDNKDYPFEINEMICKLMKKKKSHANILLQYNKNMGGIRVPYKNIAKLLKTTDKVVSVQYLRIMQKLDQRLANIGIFY